MTDAWEQNVETLIGKNEKEGEAVIGDKIDKIKNARDPKSFWSALSILRKKVTLSADIYIKDWFIFYKKLLNKGDNEPFHKAILMIRWEDIELDKEITLEEIKAEFKSLADGKAAGPDNIPNEFLNKLPIPILEKN
ncbi:hypothetical protein LAZ67_15000601 [Cordylochernes scorpioides]|uniref:Uncharacterized protein n=1 Tax=Cordylochernes scorpioides TaxID=51811 RepID=A0ABY6L874_9ARAC|nr:hypothetical protein LAZ67_15000601 [Cordylochernes scorpioides]